MTYSLFRVENPQTMQGLWYDRSGVFNPIIFNLTEGQAASLDMSFDPEFTLGGFGWFSACDSLKGLTGWFTDLDLKELAANGYGTYEFEVSQYRNLKGHSVFRREDIINSRRLS